MSSVEAYQSEQGPYVSGPEDYINVLKYNGAEVADFDSNNSVAVGLEGAYSLGNNVDEPTGTCQKIAAVLEVGDEFFGVIQLSDINGSYASQTVVTRFTDMATLAGIPMSDKGRRQADVMGLVKPEGLYFRVLRNQSDDLVYGDSDQFGFKKAVGVNPQVLISNMSNATNASVLVPGYDSLDMIALHPSSWGIEPELASNILHTKTYASSYSSVRQQAADAIPQQRAGEDDYVGPAAMSKGSFLAAMHQ
jgi:hypothetical protein